MVIFWRESLESHKGHVGVFMGFSADGNRVTVPATNAYRRTGDGWQLCLHHASPRTMGRLPGRPAPRRASALATAGPMGGTQRFHQ